MVITFTLQAAYSGATYVAGPFNISGTTNTGTVTELANNISKSTLLAGYTISNIDDATTGGTIQSIGTCSNTISWSANPCASAGSLVDTYCSGTTLYGIYNDGSCGTYDDVIEINSLSCGYNGGGGGCFIEGTNVTLADGSQVLIETLQVGDVLKSFAIDTLPLYSDEPTVLSTWNSETITGTESTASIVSITPSQVSEIIVINNLLKTTPNHHHLVKHEGVWSFVHASTVVVGDVMLDVNNNEFEITSVEAQEVETTIYKMDVESLDVFYAENTLTHNYKPPTDGTYDCQAGSCIQSVGGAYSTLFQCQQNCPGGQV
jgi:hypothetical protein